MMLCGSAHRVHYSYIKLSNSCRVISDPAPLLLHPYRQPIQTTTFLIIHTKLHRAVIPIALCPHCQQAYNPVNYLP